MTQLVARRTGNDPPIYRVMFEEIEIGSISKRTRHVEPITTYWHWGIDTMPLLGGRTEPSGDEDTFGGDLEAFRAAFFT